MQKSIILPYVPNFTEPKSGVGSETEKDEDGLPLIVFSPKGFRTFGDDCPSLKTVSQTKVQSYLVSKLNEFRKDYKKNFGEY